MDTEENRRQVSLGAHSPWKSLARFPHFHSRDEARKSGKRKARFPLSRLLFSLFQTHQKGGLAAARFAPASRLILRLENALLCGSRAFRRRLSLAVAPESGRKKLLAAGYPARSR